MIPLGWVAFGIALEILVATLAIHLARARSYHRPAAVYLAILAVAEVIRAVLAQVFFTRPGPYAGALRGVFNLDQILTLAEPVGLAWCALAVFWPSRVAWRERFLGVAFFVAALIVVSYPQLRDASYQRALLGVWIAAQGIAWTSAIVWRARAPGAWPQLTHRMVLIYASGQLVAQAGPVLAGSIFSDWRVGFGASVLLQLVAIVQQSLWIGAPMDEARERVLTPPRGARRGSKR